MSVSSTTKMLERPLRLKMITHISRSGADLMQRFQELTEEMVKTIRYNSVPDHLVGKVQLLKCNSAFRPDPRKRKRSGMS